jgi:hypothetical protein
MARPGLEPGTPRFSGTGNWRRKSQKSPANRRVADRAYSTSIPVDCCSYPRLKDVAGPPRPFRLLRATAAWGSKASATPAPARAAPPRPRRERAGCRPRRSPSPAKRKLQRTTQPPSPWNPGRLSDRPTARRPRDGPTGRWGATNSPHPTVRLAGHRRPYRVSVRLIKDFEPFLVFEALVLVLTGDRDRPVGAR